MSENTGINGNGAAVPPVAEWQEVGKEISHKANDVRVETAKQLSKAAEVLRREARDNQASPTVLQIADDVAGGLDRAANYLNAKTLEDMTADASQAVQKNPIRSVGFALLAGLFLGWLLRGGD